jgi:divalent metal cation (Fe/Co/Zn/Cd) transporter
MTDRRQEYDPARILTWAALLFVGALIFFVGLIIGWQIITGGEANTESWAALTGLIGWVTGTVSMIYNARYGTSKQAETKDAVIAQQSRTAAVMAGAQTAPVVSDTVPIPPTETKP